MTTIRQFCCDDLFKFNNINLDPFTETYGIGFYLQYLARWPEYFLVAESPAGDAMAYIMGKAEGTIQAFFWTFAQKLKVKKTKTQAKKTSKLKTFSPKTQNSAQLFQIFKKIFNQI